MLGCGGLLILNKLVWKDFTVKVTVEQTPKKDEAEDISIFEGREEETIRLVSQVPELGGCLACSKNRKEAGVT